MPIEFKNKYNDSQKRLGGEGVFFITSKTKDNFPYFREKIFCDLWIEELRLVKEIKKFKIFGFCLLYDHFHMILEVNSKIPLSEIMRSFKTNYSRDINRLIEGAVPEPRLRGVQASYRLKRDFDIINFQKYQIYTNNLKNYPKFQWQKSFHNHLIRNQNDFEKHYNYTINNYIKHDLPENWKYTSINFKELIDEIEI